MIAVARDHHRREHGVPGQRGRPGPPLSIRLRISPTRSRVTATASTSDPSGSPTRSATTSAVVHPRPSTAATTPRRPAPRRRRQAPAPDRASRSRAPAPGLPAVRQWSCVHGVRLSHGSARSRSSPPGPGRRVCERPGGFLDRPHRASLAGLRCRPPKPPRPDSSSISRSLDWVGTTRSGARRALCALF